MSPKFHNFAFDAVAFQCALSLLGFTWVAVLAHYLNVSAMGKVMVAIGVATTITTLSGFGLQHSISVKAGKYDDSFVVSNGFLAICIAGSIAGIIGYSIALIASAPEKLGINESICGVITATQLLNVFLISMMRAIHRFRFANVLSIIQPLLFTIQIIGSIALAQTLSPQIVLLEYCASAAISAFIGVILFSRLNLLITSSVNKQIINELFIFGFKAQFGNILKEAMYRADLYMVSFLLGSVAAGFYAVVLKVIEGFGRFVDALGLIMLPMIAKLNRSERNDLTKKVTLTTVAFALVISLGVAALGEHVVSIIFGQQFLPSAPLLKIGIFALIPLSAWKILANDFIGRGLLAHYAASAAVGSISIMSLNYLFLSHYGVIVAPWVLIASYSMSACILIEMAHYRLGISWSIPPLNL